MPACPATPLLRLVSLAALEGPPVDIDLTAGECLPLMGPSGSGKSRLLRAVADLDPHRGKCFLDGREQGAFSGPAWRRQVAYVPADSGWWGDIVGEHFLSGAWLAAQAPRLGLAAGCADWEVSRLSTGERQRLALLRALEREPRALLLDEPTSGLDERARRQVEALLAEWLQGDHHAALLVTHSAEQARRVHPGALLWLTRDAVAWRHPEEIPA